jgi:hypothetical protein
VGLLLWPCSSFEDHCSQSAGAPHAGYGLAVARLARRIAKRHREATPIRRQYRWFYPIDWPQLSAVIRFERANGACEQCGRRHLELVRHLGDGRWWDEDLQAWRDGRGRRLRFRADLPSPAAARITKVVLATAHLDHDPTNNRPRNLAALCQRCHMIHDRSEHILRRWITYRTGQAIGDLFLGLYEPR